MKHMGVSKDGSHYTISDSVYDIPWSERVIPVHDYPNDVQKDILIRDGATVTIIENHEERP